MISIMIGMAKATMPCIMSGGGGSESTGRRALESVKLPHTITPKKLTPSKKVFHRETKRVKINGAIIISSKLTNRYKIFNNARCNKNIAKMKRAIREKGRKRGMFGRRDGDRGTISNSDMTVNRVWSEIGKDTGVVDEVSGGTTVKDILRRRGLQRQVGEVLTERGGVPSLRRGRGRGVGDGAGKGGAVRGAVRGTVGGAMMSAVGAAMAVRGGTGWSVIRSHAIRGGMAGVGRRHVSMGAGTRARSEDAAAGRLWHRPHLNGAGPRVVWSRRGRGSGGLVALVLPLVLVVASMMRVSTPLLPLARTGTGRGGPPAEGGGAGALATKAEAEVLAVRRATFISCRSSMLRKLRKVGNGARREAMLAIESKRSSRPLMTLVTRFESEAGAPTSARASAAAFWQLR
jgi:hypothetical protein